MLPSRGLRPAQFAPLASRHALTVRNGASRKFSSLPRTSALHTTSRRSSPLQTASWRAGALSSASGPSLTTHSIRYASWYAPWSWGKSSTSISEFDKLHQSAGAANAQVLEAAAAQTVTSSTPELSPAGIDKPAIVEEAAASTETAAAPAAETVEQFVDQLLLDDIKPSVVTSADPIHAIEKFGVLKDLGLDYGWGFTAFYEWLIEHVYIYGELGWGASIILSSVLIRAGTFWFQRSGSNNMAKMAAVQPLVKDLHLDMTEAMKSGDSKRVQVLRQKQALIYKQAGTNPLASFPPLIAQGLFGFGAFRCLRGMSNLPAPGFEQGGFLWFQDLSMADPYYVLPVINGGILYLLFKYGGETGANDQTTSAGAQSALKVIMPLVMTAVTCWQPASIQIYFIASTALGAVSAKLLRTPSVRDFLKISPLPSDESKAFWTKVARGEIPLESVEQQLAAHKPTYLPPTPAAATTTTSTTKFINHRGLQVKSKAAIPEHLREAPKAKIDKNNPTRDHDYEDGPPKDIKGKAGWVMRNYRPSFVYNRVKLSVATWFTSAGQDGVAAAVLKRKKETARRKAEEYEARQKQKLGR